MASCICDNNATEDGLDRQKLFEGRSDRLCRIKKEGMNKDLRNILPLVGNRVPRSPGCQIELSFALARTSLARRFDRGKSPHRQSLKA